MMGLVAVSAVIAAVGLVNLLTIGVVQRRRELGLLRALGVSNGQVPGMVLLEAAHITVAATVDGLSSGVLLRLGRGAVAARLGPVNPDAARLPSCGPRSALARLAIILATAALDARRGGRAHPARDPRGPGRGARRVATRPIPPLDGRTPLTVRRCGRAVGTAGNRVGRLGTPRGQAHLVDGLSPALVVSLGAVGRNPLRS